LRNDEVSKRVRGCHENRSNASYGRSGEDEASTTKAIAESSAHESAKGAAEGEEGNNRS